MILAPQECTLFYKLMFALQHHVNQKLNIIPNIKSLEDYISLEMKDKLAVRNALYEHIGLIDGFVSDNPEQFTDPELAQVLDWKKFVSGKFYIERYLKKCAIFIGPEDKVYAVQGLQQPFYEIIHPGELPSAIDTVLLPFADKIVYDGLLLTYSVYFGKGMSNEFKEIYLTAKNNGNVIASFNIGQQKITTPKAMKNWQTEMQELNRIAQNLRGGQGQPALYSPVFSLIKAAIELGELSTAVAPDTDELWKAFDRVARSLNTTEKTLHRME
jgi:hypothetical protein